MFILSLITIIVLLIIFITIVYLEIKMIFLYQGYCEQARLNDIDSSEVESFLAFNKIILGDVKNLHLLFKARLNVSESTVSKKVIANVVQSVVATIEHETSRCLQDPNITESHITMLVLASLIEHDLGDKVTRQHNLDLTYMTNLPVSLANDAAAIILEYPKYASASKTVNWVLRTQCYVLPQPYSLGKVMSKESRQQVALGIFAEVYKRHVTRTKETIILPEYGVPAHEVVI